jgi:hypothetical protein
MIVRTKTYRAKNTPAGSSWSAVMESVRVDQDEDDAQTPDMLQK